jgi:hypothetical protein
MSGVYQAKAAPAAAAWSGPAAWLTTWPFPGAFPPGYVPILTIVPDTDDEYPIGGTAENQKFTLKDNQPDGLFQTAQPSESVVLTATLESSGKPVFLRESGGVYSSSITLTYQADGDFYAGVGDLEYNVDETNAGDYIVLRYESSPLNQKQISGIIRILIITSTQWTAKITLTMEDATFNVSGDCSAAAQILPEAGETQWPGGFIYVQKELIGGYRWSNTSHITNEDGSYDPAEAPFNFGVRMQDLTIPPDTGDDTKPWILDLLQANGVMVLEVENLDDAGADWRVGYVRGIVDTGVPPAGTISFSVKLQTFYGGEEQESFTYSENNLADQAPATPGYPSWYYLWTIDKASKKITKLY